MSSPQTPLGPVQPRLCVTPSGDGPALTTASASRGLVRPRRSFPAEVEAEAVTTCTALFCSATPSSRSSRPQGRGGEGLRRDLLAFYDRHDDALADLMVHLEEGAVLAHVAIVEARLPALLRGAEAVDEADPQPLMDDRCRRAGTVRQVRISDLSRRTLVLLLRWAYGACAKYEVERLGTLLREAILESLDLTHFASVLRESHVRQISGLKQGCMRFALHNFDTLVERPELFMHTLSDLPEVVSDLFRLGRLWKDAEGEGGRSAPGRPAPAVPSTIVSDFCRLFDAARLEEHGEEGGSSREDSGDRPRTAPRHRGQHDFVPDCRVVVGEDMYLAHSAVLAARSEFFRAAFASEMVERTSLMVTLQHCRGDRPRRESVLAMLYFLYTGKTTKVNGSNAIEVLSLLGAEHGDEGDCSGGFLQLHDAATLRRACEAAAESAESLPASASTH
ncbi:hypothetical protein AK812_SmicGene7959 [Symbiodinium microadriaticum]|uniref:BTB domain-containing protein n=1 Tax=Symbiodinium microadriaticum TaxID=2951 RepID=A0A1Q9EM97_SYMMI|nr:hypothetical protein AK812_SmicGene7959 [Symbiodinium microadriaticum]